MNRSMPYGCGNDSGAAHSPEVYRIFDRKKAAIIERIYNHINPIPLSSSKTSSFLSFMILLIPSPSYPPLPFPFPVLSTKVNDFPA